MGMFNLNHAAPGLLDEFKANADSLSKRMTRAACQSEAYGWVEWIC
jgi:hypothetical protein